MRLPPFLRVPLALAAATAFFYLTVEAFSLGESLLCAIAFLMAWLFVVFAALWWTGREDFTPVGHGGADAPRKASPLLQRTIIPLSLLLFVVVHAVIIDLYRTSDSPLLESPVVAAILVGLGLWILVSAAFGRPRALLPKVLRTKEKAT